MFSVGPSGGGRIIWSLQTTQLTTAAPPGRVQLLGTGLVTKSLRLG